MTPCWFLALLALCSPLWHAEGVVGWGVSPVPSESECQPYIEKALKERTPETLEAVDATSSDQLTAQTQSTNQEGSIEETNEATTKESTEENASNEAVTESGGEVLTSAEATDTVSNEDITKESAENEELPKSEVTESAESAETQESLPESTTEEEKPEEGIETEAVAEEATGESSSETNKSNEATSNDEATSTEKTEEELSTGEEQSVEAPEGSTNEEKSTEEETVERSGEEIVDETPISTEINEAMQKSEEVSEDTKTEEISGEDSRTEESSTEVKSQEAVEESVEGKTSASTEEVIEKSAETHSSEVAHSEEITEKTVSTESTDSSEALGNMESEISAEKEESVEETIKASTVESTDQAQESVEVPVELVSSETKESSEEVIRESSSISEETTTPETAEETASGEHEVAGEVIEATPAAGSEKEAVEEPQAVPAEPPAELEATAVEGEEKVKESEPTVEDQLTLDFEIPTVRRPREHISEILHLSPEAAETELLLSKTVEATLKDLKRLYDAAIKPLEILFKYRDLSNRHFGDPEIFSKPLILFMGPWSGGKSSILNYLMDNEFKSSSLRTGAEPSPAYFNILMWGEREEVLDGTQLAADWTFSGLQKFGQGLLDRLRGLRLNTPLLEKVNMVEIPGILEIRKQVERLFPFNDACQWFIDRADIIFLVYDPSKLDVGPETEAILDQLKGREYQTRIILNKADQVKPEELMRVQGTLIWNISPLMSSQEPPVMYSTSLWSVPYEHGAPSRLLHAQERAFLRDLRLAIDKRVENKIASARRFAVRVRNHAKMVDCYLTTYYNHKSFFGNRKKVADDIIEHPQNYHIYEGLSTLTNISRYDLPDPEVYRDFFRLNPLFEFQRLSDTCTYFRGCPINRLDVAIAYDLPELVGKYKKQAEAVVDAAERRRSGGKS